ncbi:hypothetical protein Pint_21404 [Pistacia integerrima]|uniref:Uncharacterized protein n=1 Tax=Pistacia integerrima TaxID=434235 RepID=A0ACC0X9N0_9ROSI|nr:hypothetical protein Pint_21404 [Pistacia integerrima]
MERGSVSRENGVLKLVYPGGFVELHEKPITAAEVMKRNPRHCVTRPDVFKFPWVVVKPESVLKPGRVFYVVPNHTLRRLIQVKGGSQNKAFPGDSSPRPKVTSRMESWNDDKNARGQGHDRMYTEQDSSDISGEITNLHRLLKKGNPVASENKVNTSYEDWSEDFSGSNFLVGPDEKYMNKFYRKQSLTFESVFDLKTKQDSEDDSPKKQNKNHQQKQENRQVHLFLEEKPFFPVKYDSRNDKVHDLLPKYDSRLQLNSSQPIAKLKSCLKKHNNIPTPRDFRVRFALDEDDHKKLGLDFQRLSTE